MAELGQKHTCADCETRYYDLGRQDATCPKCGSVNRVDEEAALATTLGRRPAKRAQPTVVEPDDAEPDDGEDDEDEDLLGDLKDDEDEDDLDED